MDVSCIYYDPEKGFCALIKDTCNHVLHYTCFYERTEQGEKNPGKKKKEEKGK
jgi:hypothetical protein